MTMTPKHSRIVHNESGQMLIMTALMLPVLLGFAALALDAGFAFETRKQIQTAADSAATAAAFELFRGEPPSPQTTLENIARNDATLNGFEHGVNSVTV